jgi:hypothetical protein
MTGESRLDALARDLANSQVSRRTALRRFGASFAAAALPSFLVAEEALARCPPSRKCGSKCCSSGQKCKHGKCKCKSGLKKCGKKCVNAGTDPANCGSCGHACAPGQTCVGGQCTGGGTTTGPVCGNNVKEAGEVCDGTELGGATCASLGFVSGTLGCSSSCQSFDTSGCVAPACTTPATCPGADSECQARTCVNGTCGSTFVAAGTALSASAQVAGDCKRKVCDGAGGVVSEDDAADVASDGNQCTDDVCVNAATAHPAKAAGAACNQNGGTICNGSGACVQPECAQPSDCPGPDWTCRTPTCSNGFCGASFAPNATPVSFQVFTGFTTETRAGCVRPGPQRAYCNGSGGGYGSGACPGGQNCQPFNAPFVVSGVEYGYCG